MTGTQQLPRSRLVMLRVRVDQHVRAYLILVGLSQWMPFLRVGQP